MPANFDSAEKTNGKGVDPSACKSSRFDMEGGYGQKPDPIKEFRESLKGVSDAVTEFAQARVDSVRVKARSIGLSIALAIAGAVGGVVFIIVSMVLLLTGLSGAIARLLNAPNWAGYLIVGAICLGAPLTFGLIKLKKLKKQWLNDLREKYAGRTEVQCHES